jgi:hypothetical protein
VGLMPSPQGKVSCTKNLSTNGIRIHSGVSFKLSSETPATPETAEQHDKVSFNIWDLGGQEWYCCCEQTITRVIIDCC